MNPFDQRVPSRAMPLKKIFKKGMESHAFDLDGPRVDLNHRIEEAWHSSVGDYGW